MDWEDALVETLQADLVAQDLKEKYMYDVNLIVSEDMCIDSDSFEDFKTSVSESDEETKATFVKNASATTDAEAMQYNVLSELDKRAKEILAEIITDEMSDLQKVKAIHDYMVVNFDYDYDNYLMKTIPYYSYTPQGAFENGYIVCAGYAKTFALFCKHADIRCEYVVGLGGEGLHAWNQVEIDGEWYNIDVTWDDPTWLGKEFDNHISNNYNYFLLCDEHMYENHTAYNAKNIRNC
ncbi:MAG: hypothetical protein IJ282_01750 [Lachnospiraceae bacterium]|nr:hypothetical protein [Lachnospiraceae bacterium]